MAAYSWSLLMIRCSPQVDGGCARVAVERVLGQASSEADGTSTCAEEANEAYGRLIATAAELQRRK